MNTRNQGREKKKEKKPRKTAEQVAVVYGDQKGIKGKQKEKKR